MSFPNYEGFQNPQGQPDASGAGAGAPPQQDTPMGNQMQDNTGQFQGGNGGDPGSAGGQQPGGDAKTTLWYVQPSPLPQIRAALLFAATYYSHLLIFASLLIYIFTISSIRYMLIFPEGWVSLNRGSTRTSFAAFGSTWESKSM